MLAQGPVVAKVPAAQKLSFHGINTVAQRDSTVYLNVNTGGVAVAVLFGQIRFTGRTLRDGEICFWSRAASEVEVAEFDAATFLSRRRPQLEKRVVASLEEAAARQASDLWWGTVAREQLLF